MPKFDDRNLLPPGVHDATLKEVEQLFGRFQRSDQRPKLFRKLREYLKALKQARIAISVIVDGSFVMGCVDEPEDMDLIVVLPADWDASAALRPYQYNLVSKRRVKEEYGFDLVAVQAGSIAEQDWTRFFGRVNVKWCLRFGWPERSTKGILRVSL